MSHGGRTDTLIPAPAVLRGSPDMPHKPIAAVTWDDAHATIETTYAEHELPHAAAVIVTLGWILREDETGISVANEYCGEGTWRGVTFVPHGMVRDVTRVATPRKKREKREKAEEAV